MSETSTYRNIIYRLLPGSRANARRLAGQAGACRFVWNTILGQHNDAHEEAKANGEKPPSVSFFSLGKEFTSLRNEIPWLCAYSFAITRYVLKYQADAWKAFFRGEAGHPRFKSRHGSTPSFTIPQAVTIRDDMISIPRVGPMRIRRKGSRRRMRTRLRLQRLQRKRANRRRNWQHQVSRRIANRAGTVIVEKLNTQGMTKSARGTLENPGTKVKAKSGLNREILNTGWHGMKEKLAYKCALVEIDPAFTSETCYNCGWVNKASRPSQAEFTCVACGHADHADLNAARNIMASGIGASARRGAFALATPVTREIDRNQAA